MKKSTVILRWGIITGLTSCLIYHVLYLTGLMFSPLRFLVLAALFLGLFFGTRQYRKSNGGYLGFGKGYLAGFLIAAIFTTIFVAYVFFYFQLYPGAIDSIAWQTANELIKKGRYNPQWNMILNSVKNISPWFFVIIGLPFWLIIGSLISLITAALNLRKKPFSNAPILSPNI